MSVKMLVTAPTDAQKSVTVKPDPTRIDPLKLKLGKQTARHDPRTLLLASYATPALPAPPATMNLTKKVKAGGSFPKTTIGFTNRRVSPKTFFAFRKAGFC